MRESIFVSELVRSLKSIGIFAYKIPDAPVSYSKKFRFSPEKVCDVVACDLGQFIAIECKQFKEWRALRKSDIRESQWRGLESVYRSGGYAMVFLNIRLKRELNIALKFSYVELKKLFKDRKSIPKEELKLRNCFLGKRGQFDLNTVFVMDDSGQYRKKSQDAEGN